MRYTVSMLIFGFLGASAGLAAADPPARVGRLSYIEGTVSFHPPGAADASAQAQNPDANQWVPATLNYPVTSGESFWTEPDARAEFEIGGSAFRLDHGSELDVMKLDDRAIDLQLDQGAVNIHLPQLQGEVSVMTPRGRVDLTAPGSYDIDAGQPAQDGANGGPPDRVQVTVLDGSARFEGERGSVDIRHSEEATISGDPMNVSLDPATPSDFDNWALARDQRDEAAAAAPPVWQSPSPAAAPPTQPVPPAVTGAQDLGQYGSWSEDPTYGAVWYPTAVPADWAPYRYGHWAFVPPWGWTWIDDAPWGFAPFHYGRWAYFHDRWGWVPGSFVAAPVYAPALVAFVGGNGWGISISAGAPLAAIGWVALAPGEVYHPYYRASTNYLRQVNVANVNRTVINNITVNRNITIENFHNASAATVVPAAAFTHAAPVHQARVAVPAQQLAALHPANSMSGFQPGAFARSGRADPAVAQALVPHAGAAATVAPQRVTTAAPSRLPTQALPTAPGPHRFARNERPGARPPANPSSPANSVATEETSHPAAPGPTAPATAATPSEHPANGGRLAPHPAPPNHGPVAARQATPPAAASPQSPANAPVWHQAVPNAPASTSHQAAVAPPAPNRPASHPPEAHQNAAPASPALRPQTAAIPHFAPPPAHPTPMTVQHPEQQTHIAPTPQAWTRAPGAPPAPQAAPQHAAPRPQPAVAHPQAQAPAPQAHPAAPSSGHGNHGGHDDRKNEPQH